MFYVFRNLMPLQISDSSHQCDLVFFAGNSIFFWYTRNIVNWYSLECKPFCSYWPETERVKFQRFLKTILSEAKWLETWFIGYFLVCRSISYTYFIFLKKLLVFQIVFMERYSFKVQNLNFFLKFGSIMDYFSRYQGN